MINISGLFYEKLLCWWRKSERPFVVLSLLKTTMLFWSKKTNPFLNHITKRFWYDWNFRKWELQDLGASRCWRFATSSFPWPVRWSEYGLCCLAKKMGAKETLSFEVRNRNIPIPTSRKKNILSYSLLSIPELLTARYVLISLTSQMPFLWSIFANVSCLDGI